MPNAALKMELATVAYAQLCKDLLLAAQVGVHKHLKRDTGGKKNKNKIDLGMFCLIYFILFTSHNWVRLLTQIPLGLEEDLFSFFLCLETEEEEVLVWEVFVMVASWLKELLSLLCRRCTGSSKRGDSGGGNSFSSLFFATFFTELLLLLGHR